MNKIELMRRSRLFHDLEPRLMERVAELARTKEFSKGAQIIRDGDTLQMLIGITDGLAKISSSSPSGRQFTGDILMQGDFFGELTLIDGAPSPGGVTALTKLNTLVIQRSDFLDLLDNEPQFNRRILLNICEWLRVSVTLIQDLSFLSLEGRLARRLVDFSERMGVTTADGVQIAMRLSQQELADLIGSTREAVNKKLQEWRDAGHIHLSRNRIVIRNIAALQQILDDNYHR